MRGKIQRSILRAFISFLGVSLSVPSRAFSATMTVTNNLAATIQANGELSVPGTTTLSHSGTLFASFTGTLTLQYRARTTSAGGGTITLKATRDFQSGGPSVSSGDLSYSCGAAGLGTACTSTTASTASATTVVTLPSAACTGGGAPCSGTDPNSVLVNFTLSDRPSVQTGTYTANVQFTISAT
jgi:hypothetical protein